MRLCNTECWRAFGVFQGKYSKYRPLTVKFDGNFTADMNNISTAISGSREDIREGDLTCGHEELSQAGPKMKGCWTDRIY